jgi:hypothetical protein
MPVAGIEKKKVAGLFTAFGYVEKSQKEGQNQ